MLERWGKEKIMHALKEAKGQSNSLPGAVGLTLSCLSSVKMDPILRQISPARG